MPEIITGVQAESHWSAFDADGIRRLVAAEDRHFWFRARNEIISGLIEAPIRGLPDGFHILEVGCGSGNVLRVVRDVAAGRGVVEGLELSAAAAEVARARTGLKVLSGHLSDVDPASHFDLIVAFDVLEHIADEAEVLTEIRVRLARSGRLILTVPAHPSLWSSFDDASGHVRRYTPDGLRRTLSSSGFDVEYLSYFMTLLFPPMWVKRRLSREHAPAKVLDSDFRIVPILNQIAYGLLRRDASIMRRRRRLPMGTSLAVIASPSR